MLDVQSVAGFADVVALILGVLVMTWEYRHDTITETFLVEPRRERVVVSKALAAMITGAVLAAAAVALALAIAYGWIGDEPLVSFGSEVWERGGRMIASSAIYGAIGVGIGAIIRGQALAIVLVFVWFLIVEPLVSGLYDQVGRYLPGAALTQLAGQSGSDAHLSTGPAVGMALLYLVGFVGVGAYLTVRRDVT